MPSPLRAEDIERIAELRNEGHSINLIADWLNISRSTVINYSRLKSGYRRSTDWSADYQEIEYDSSQEPYFQYPDDLPRLERDEFNWTPDELAKAIHLARHIRHPVYYDD